MSSSNPESTDFNQLYHELEKSKNNVLEYLSQLIQASEEKSTLTNEYNENLEKAIVQFENLCDHFSLVIEQKKQEELGTMIHKPDHNTGASSSTTTQRDTSAAIRKLRENVSVAEELKTLFQQFSDSKTVNYNGTHAVPMQTNDN
eukprot:gb/GECH01001935.1/.p1 GENE.gb/GECH01001935.1/~~gb/GECH01001935.1/.p1  ORF type:complete len:145 (+),score=41.50 gb/GECH01001935.1/:1-435(+)